MSVFRIRVPDPEMPAVSKFFLSHSFESDTLTKCARCVSMMPIKRTWLVLDTPYLMGHDTPHLMDLSRISRASVSTV